MAISQDGFIAGPNDETPWSDEEWIAFQEFTRSCDVVLLGRRTFELMRQENEFIKGVNYVVVTNHPLQDMSTVTISSAADMPHAPRVGIIGGGDLNGRLAELGVIDEVFLDVEAINLGAGMRLYGNHGINLPLELLNAKQLGKTTTQKHYKLMR
jgi:dihydrofolate reductase